MDTAVTPAQQDDMADVLSPPEEIIDAARNGRMFILVDDEDRENEGDLIIPAQMATPDAINFMAMHGRGLICLAIDSDTVRRLGLPLIASQNKSRHQTAFTVSIEAREGVTTGISAADRARTVQVAIDPRATPADLVSPGHVFPLAAQEGGVLVRAGHTEAAVDIARLAGLAPAGVICEIMNDDGTMARLPDLVPFAAKHGLKIGSIADLIAYRRRTEKLVERLAETTLDSHFGGHFRALLYRNLTNGIEHVALIKGQIDSDQPVLVRMHALSFFEDILVERGSAKSDLLHASMEEIGRAGSGVIVIIREPSGAALTERFRHGKDETEDESPERQKPRVLRDYGVGAQILLDLGIRDMILLSATKRSIVGLDGYGLRVVEQRAVPQPSAP